VTVVSKSSY